MTGSSMPLERSRSKFPCGLLGMLAMVAAVELTVAARNLDFTTIWADDWRTTARVAPRRVKDRDVLVFGDSLIKFAVLPKQIEATTGIRSFNLGLNAGTVPSAYFLLRQALEAGARPRAIVADFCTLMLPDRPIRSIRLYPDLATTRDVVELAWISGDADFLASTLLGKLLPSYKCRYEIRDNVKGALGGLRSSPWPSQKPIWDTWKFQDGAQPMPTDGSGGMPNPDLTYEISPTGWQCDPINAAYVEKFLELAESKQIPVFWLIPPLNPDVRAFRAIQGSDEAYTRFVDATLARHPGVVVIDGRRSDYARTLYMDPMHLAHTGAKVLSTDLGQILANRLGKRGGTERWVNLPQYDVRTGEVARGEPAGVRK